MTLGEMKKNVYRLIEEYMPSAQDYTDDSDFKNKINPVINQIMFDLCKYKKIHTKVDLTVTEGQSIDLYNNNSIPRFCQLNKIKGVDYTQDEQFITFEEAGTATIYYYKNPEVITDSTADTYNFELKDEMLAIMPYGVAGDLLGSDPANQYGRIFMNRYKELLQLVDPRISSGIIKIEGGIDV